MNTSSCLFPTPRSPILEVRLLLMLEEILLEMQDWMYKIEGMEALMMEEMEAMTTMMIKE